MAMRNLLGGIALLGLSSPAAAVPQPRRQLQVSPSLLGAIDIDLCALDSLCDRQLVPGKHHTYYQFSGATCSVAVPDGLSLTFSQTAEEATLDFSIDTIALSCGPINWSVAYRKDWAPDMAASGTVTLSSTNAAQNSLSLSARITQNSDDAASPGLVLDPTCSATHAGGSGFALDMQLDGSDLGGDIVDLFEGDIKNAIVRAVNGAVCSQTVGLPSKLPGLLDAVLDEIHPDDARYQVLAGGKTRAAAALSRARLDLASSTVAAALKGGDSSTSSSGDTVPVPVQHTMKNVHTGADSYTMKYGKEELRGTYERKPPAYSCGGKSVYEKWGWQGKFYLFRPDESSYWMFGTHDDMEFCRSTGHYRASGCDEPNGGCVWKKNSARTRGCRSGSWCTDHQIEVTSGGGSESWVSSMWG